MSSRRAADVVVVGAGIVGAAVVWRLAQDDVQVDWVVGGGFAGSASAAAGAMLAVYSEVSAHQDGDVRDLEVSTRRQGRALWDTWLPALAEASGMEVEVSAGIHVVGRGPQDGESMDAIRDAAAAFGGRCDVVAPADVPGCLPDRGWEPHEAVFLADEASLDGGGLLDMLGAANRARPSVTVIHESAATVDRSGVVTTDDGTELVAGAVVLAAGMRTADLLQASGLDALVPTLFAGRGVSIVAR
ncbi:MAG: FAD-dependent oxidoreductase, partial [Acidimicrobiales bacterium]